MGNGRRQNALLVEIIITVLFFALSATVILEVFSTSYLQTTYADSCNAAVAEAQNLAARMYVSDAPEVLLESEGFVFDGSVWQQLENDDEESDNDYVLQISLDTEQTAAGELRTALITALRGERTILELPCAHYVPREVAQ